MAGRRKRTAWDDAWHRWRIARRAYRMVRHSSRTLTSAGIVTFCLVVQVYLWWACGSLLRALALEVAVAGTSVGVWLVYRWRRTGLTPRESSEQLLRQRRTVRRWAKACKRAGLTSAPRLRKVASDGQDVTAIIHAGQSGVTRKELARGLEALADLTFARQITARQRGHSGKYDLTFHFGDTLTDIVMPDHVPAAAAGSIKLGITDAGAPFTVPILNSEGQSILVPTLAGGVSRSGKSGLAWAWLLAFIEAGIPLRVRVLDLGGGTEFAALRHALENQQHTDTFRVHTYTSNPKDAEKVIGDAVDAMNARLYTMGQRGMRVHKPTIAEPYDLVLCDEMLRMRNTLRKAHEGPFGDLLSQGAKASHSFLGLAQVGHADVLGPARELIPLRFCLRTRTPEQTQTIVGGADLAQLMPAHRIPKSQRGVAWALDEDKGDDPTRLRIMRITDEATELIARGVLPGTEAATQVAPKLHVVRAGERVA
jgi:hypothetical protein